MQINVKYSWTSANGREEQKKPPICDDNRYIDIQKDKTSLKILHPTSI